MGVLPSSPGNVVQCFVTNKMLSEVSVDEAYAVFSNHIINFWGFCPPPSEPYRGSATVYYDWGLSFSRPPNLPPLEKVLRAPRRFSALQNMLMCD